MHCPVRIVDTLSIKGRFPIHQIGLENSNTELIMRLADDVLLEPDFFRKVMPHIKKDKKCGAIAGVWNWYQDTWEQIDHTPFDINALKFWKCLNNQIVWTWGLKYQFTKHQKEEVICVDHLYNSYI